jgi:hypothetical protein
MPRTAARKSSTGPKRLSKSSPAAPKTPAVLVPLSAQAFTSYRNSHIQESHIDNLFGDGNTAVIYHKIISVRISSTLRNSSTTGNELEAAAQMCAENVVQSLDNPEQLMTFEQWMEIDLGSLSKIVEAMSNNVGKD